MSNYSDQQKNDFYEHIKSVLSEETKSRDHAKIKHDLEYSVTRSRIRRIENNPIQGNYDFQHLSEIHYEIFHNLYDFAGKQRVDDFSKGVISPEGKREIGNFVPVKDIDSAFSAFNKDLKDNHFLKNLEKSDFIEKFTIFYARINEIHPFDEGNGRATKTMMQQLANEAGYKVNYEQINRQDWNYASKRSLSKQAMFYGSDLITQEQDLTYLKEVMSKIITPLQLNYEQLKQQLKPNQAKAFNALYDEILKIFKDHPNQLNTKLNALNEKLPDIINGKYKIPEFEKNKGHDR